MMNEESLKASKNFHFPKDILNEIELVKAQLKEEEHTKKSEISEMLDEELDFRFTAMTEGLGFHQDAKNPVIDVSPTKSSAASKKSTPLYNQNVGLKKELNPIDRADLSPIYNNAGTNRMDSHPLFSHTSMQSLKTETKTPAIETPNLIEEKKNIAQLKDQVFSWAIDMLVINFILALAIAITFVTLGVYELEVVKKLFTAAEAATYIAPFFVFFYLFYFTILDREGNRTLGKRLMRIRIIAKYDDQKLGLTQSFLRAAITLLSSLALGLPLLMDFQGKLTDSMVIKEDF